MSPEEWREIRGQALTRLWGEDVASADWISPDAVLGGVEEHEELIIWYGAGMDDQLSLVRQLDWSARQDTGTTRISLLSVADAEPGRLVRSVGVLNSDQMPALLPDRHGVTPAEWQLARQAWAAFCSPDPMPLQELLAGDTSPLPYLGDAILLHLRQFPSLRNGLSREEESVLREVEQRREWFIRVLAWRLGLDPAYFSDFYWRWVMDGLAEAHAPAISLRPPHHAPRTRRPGQPRIRPDTYREHNRSLVSLTEVGHDLLAGRADWVRLNGIDRWLGGVHLQGAEAAWRWDEERRQLVAMG